MINIAFSDEICETLRNASIIAQDGSNTFLGLVVNSFHSKSIFNEYGSYGSEYSSKSIWYDYGSFGGEYSSYSPFNTYTSTPPMFIKNGQVIGYLSSNKYLESPGDLISTFFNICLNIVSICLSLITTPCNL